MSTPKDGGPAFPATEAHGCNSGCPGMTLRDYFAAKAMQAWLVGVDSPVIDKCASKAYEIADAMLKAREAA